MLSEDQKKMVDAVFVIVLIKVFACFLLLFNPLDRIKYHKAYAWTITAAKIICIFSSILQILSPIVASIYCGS